jgi:hypothetical protein
MASSITNWVWENSRSANSSRLVLLAIAYRASRDGSAKMSIPELAQTTKLGERTVQRAVDELVRLGELQAERSSGGHHPSNYQVIMSRGVNPAPLEDARGVNPAPPAPGVPILHPVNPAPLEPDIPQARPPRGVNPAPLENDPLEVVTTGRSKAQVKDVSEVPLRDDVQRLCAHLADRIEDNGSKRPAVTAKWRQAARLMLDKDGRTEEQVTAAINWCQNDEFWRSNILSMPKLREKYDQLRLQASRATARKPSRQQETDQLFDRAMQRAKAREETIDPQRNGHPDPVRQSALPRPGD